MTCMQTMFLYSILCFNAWYLWYIYNHFIFETTFLHIFTTWSIFVIYLFICLFYPHWRHGTTRINHFELDKSLLCLLHYSLCLSSYMINICPECTLLVLQHNSCSFHLNMLYKEFLSSLTQSPSKHYPPPPRDSPISHKSQINCTPVEVLPLAVRQFWRTEPLFQKHAHIYRYVFLRATPGKSLQIRKNIFIPCSLPPTSPLWFSLSPLLYTIWNPLLLTSIFHLFLGYQPHRQAAPLFHLLFSRDSAVKTTTRGLREKSRDPS